MPDSRVLTTPAPPRAIPCTVAQSWWADGWCWALIGLGAWLLLSGLGHGVLWQDEAETALLARRVLEFGYPRATDSINPIDIQPFGYGPAESWLYSPWLQFYFLAGVFAVVGPSTLAARWPFALCGLVSIILTWRLAARWSDDRRLHRLSVALLVCSVPFLLHMRQCRYYALTTLLVLAVVLAYERWLSQPIWRRGVWLGLWLTLLFHTNFGTFAPTVGALAVYAWWWGDGARRWRLAAVLAGVAALTVPWALVFYRSAFVGAVTPERLYRHAEYYVRITNKYFAPIAVMALTALTWRLWRLRRPGATAAASVRPELTRLWWLLLLAHAAFLLVPDQRHMRYLIPALPCLVLLEAWWLTGWLSWRRNVGVVVMAAALLTSVLQSAHVRVPLVSLVDELTHRYRGPLDGVVEYLAAHARPGERVAIPYDDRTLLFYLPQLRVEPPSQFAQRAASADWVVLRRDWLPEGFLTGAQFQQLTATHERIELDAPDVLWQNREDPGSHHFRTVTDAPRVVMYRRRVTDEGADGR